MDFTLNEAQKALQAKAREFCESVLQVHELTVEETGHLPEDEHQKLKAAVVEWGFAGINHDQADGGRGYDIFAQTLINEQLGREAGDQCVREISDRLRPGLRMTDLVARYGGVIFAAILPATDGGPLIDREGRVVGAYQGPAEWDSEEAKTLIGFYLKSGQSASLH